MTILPVVRLGFHTCGMFYAPWIIAALLAQNGPPLDAKRRRDIDRIILAHEADIAQCRALGLKKDAPLNGKTIIAWVIKQDGTVDRAKQVSTTIKIPEVNACLLRAVKSWHFGARPTEAEVNNPFIFVAPPS